jgi:4'-phosphopantetheinyl transferase
MMEKQNIWFGWVKTDTSGEKSQSPAKRKEAARNQTLLGRKLLEALFWEKYDINLCTETEPIRKEAAGKPYLVNHPGIYYNISHSGDYAACAVSDCPIGIDIQYHEKRNLENVARKILAADELESYEQSGCREEMFYYFWTKKESCLKYTGQGITCEMNTLTYEQCAFFEPKLWPDYTISICIPENREEKVLFREMKIEDIMKCC